MKYLHGTFIAQRMLVTFLSIVRRDHVPLSFKEVSDITITTDSGFLDIFIKFTNRLYLFDHINTPLKKLELLVHIVKVGSHYSFCAYLSIIVNRDLNEVHRVMNMLDFNSFFDWSTVSPLHPLHQQVYLHSDEYGGSLKKIVDILLMQFYFHHFSYLC